MCPETTNGSIIPVERNTVKKLMGSLLIGLPVVATDYDVVSVSDEITSAEFDTAVVRLDVFEKQVDIRARFKRGSMWSWIHRHENRGLLTAWLAQVRLRIPDATKRKLYLHNMSECGAVADRWPNRKRSDKYSWRYYRTHNEDGSPLSDVVDAKPYFKTVGVVTGESELWVECAGHHDKRIMVGLSAETLESVRVAMGWQVAK